MIIPPSDNLKANISLGTATVYLWYRICRPYFNLLTDFHAVFV